MRRGRPAHRGLPLLPPARPAHPQPGPLAAGRPQLRRPLDDYRAFALNHELGHQIGYGHEACPAAGQPAPVMQQQSTDRKGCTPNPWPYPQAPTTPTLYRGPAIP
ncbi:DUF3152 domain-containing protein [Catellatospora bangladeshensis]|uniref:DUF3152 domain-containing protein n=1 Tax=Catellatospora bangladeshensis TaxID=310355 RepID=UPI0036120C0C